MQKTQNDKITFDVLVSELKDMNDKLGSLSYYMFGIKYGHYLQDANLTHLVRSAGLTESMSKELNKGKRIYEILQKGEFGLSLIEVDAPNHLFVRNLISNLNPGSNAETFSQEELIQKVRDSFIRYWEIIDEHGAEIELYVSKFEETLNAAIAPLDLGFTNVFEITVSDQYQAVMNAICQNNPTFDYLNQKDGPNGDRYYIWSANRKYSSYLKILSFSDFFGNVRKQQTNTVAIATTISEIGKNYLRAMRTKPFLLLAGISGTGKSRLVKQLAFASCPDIEELRKDITSPGNYCLIEVKPNWHDSSELLGYDRAISNDYYATKFLRFLAKAMRYPDVPFFVCLDEMNLAPVEQYFAEFLSILETRKKTSEDVITTDPLLEAKKFAEYEGLAKELLGLNKEKDTEKNSYCYATSDPPAEYQNRDEQELCKNGLRLPQNVIVIGTVNMDETTHQFSRKVIDRAMTIEMNIAEGRGEFDNFFKSTRLGYYENPLPKELFLAPEASATDAIGSMSETDKEYIKANVPQLLAELNKTLDNTPFKVAFRVENELILYFNALRADTPDVEAPVLLRTAMDSIMMMKVLPRIEGDEDLLREPLKRLIEFTATKNYLQSKAKIEEMKERLDRGHFTSYWP